MSEKEISKTTGEVYTKGKAYTVLKGGHRHKGVVLTKGDKLTPKSEGQFNFLNENGVI